MAAAYKHFIVLSGEAGAGKDSTANVLVERHNYLKLSLSDDMKIFCMRVFGWSAEQLFGQSSLRNEPDPKWARPCPKCNGSGTDFNYPVSGCSACDGDGKLNDNSPRRVLQLLGSEWGRDLIHPDIWTMAARPRFEKVLQLGRRIVVNDARFDNDRNNLASWLGAKRVDVRVPVPKKRKKKEAWRQHPSELSRPNDDQVDYIVTNDEAWPFPGLPAKVEAMLLSLYGET